MAAHHLPGGALQPWQPAASSGGNVTAAKQVDHHFEESLLRLAASQKVGNVLFMQCAVSIAAVL